MRTNLIVIAIITAAALAGCDAPRTTKRSVWPSPDHRVDIHQDGTETYHQRMSYEQYACPGEFIDGECWVELPEPKEQD